MNSDVLLFAFVCQHFCAIQLCSFAVLVANLTQEELSNPLIDCVLEPGDLLYMPRGAIHQAMALEDEHSLHITLSTHQQNTWSNLLHLVSLSPACFTRYVIQ